jgi:hypothetical protein
MGASLIPDIGEAHRVEFVQGSELAVRVPPFGGHPAKFFQLCGFARVGGVDFFGCIHRSNLRALARRVLAEYGYANLAQ